MRQAAFRPREAPIEEFVNTVIEFVKQHDSWAVPIVFLLAFGESFAFVSLLLPAGSISSTTAASAERPASVCTSARAMR